jgi:DNA-binding transcriptional MerR regulator
VPEYSILDLAKLADVTPRTVRYYVAQGLLPAPDPQGPRTTYTDEHLQRLLAIKQMQAAHLPLAEIRTRLEKLGARDVSELVNALNPAPPEESAADYVRRVLGSQSRPAPAPAMSVVAAPAEAIPALERSQWDRHEIGPDVEIHVRRPLTRSDTKKVLNLIAYARQLFREER